MAPTRSSRLADPASSPKLFHNKQLTRLAFKVGALALLVVGALAVHGAAARHEGAASLLAAAKRRLDEVAGAATETAANCEKPTLPMVVAFIIGVIYIFLGIAIVCDELFVPALEQMAENMGLSDDVAGATLMAAGGSAPELATSLIGTFQKSSVGFGTIVGSAVFNVLFVIGMCALYTPKKFAPLTLTWWPLARDCTYYIITLATLAHFFSDSIITTTEAIIQFSLYFGYVLLMSQSEKLEGFVKSKLCKCGGSSVGDARAAVLAAVVPVGDDEAADSMNKSERAESHHHDPHAAFTKPSTFRAGILQMLTSGKGLAETAAVGVVSKIKGDVNETFLALDKDHDGSINKDELTNLLQLLDPHGSMPATEQEVTELLAKLDTNGNGSIQKAEFTKWYLQSEERLHLRTRELFHKFDMNNNGKVDDKELPKLMEALVGKMHGDAHADLQSAIESFKTEVNTTPGECTYDDFKAWYNGTIFWDNHVEQTTQAMEAHTAGLLTLALRQIKDIPSMKPTQALTTVLLLPVNVMLGLTVPDCRVVNQEKYCIITFVMSIVWIGVFSWFLVDWISALGLFFEIPIFIMGLTFLAAGTSVPDLLSSVVVARLGKGDMAVSSSIGSNIFDVAVGLPLPWLLFTLIKGEDVVVGAEGVAEAILILLCMVALVVIGIAGSKWKMSHSLGGGMFLLYFLFLAFQLVRNWPLVPDC